MVGLVTTEFPEGQKHNEIDSYFIAINPAKHTETDLQSPQPEYYTHVHTGLVHNDP